MKEEIKVHNLKDYAIDVDGENFGDGSGEVEIVSFAFYCPDCGMLCGAINEGGRMGCGSCGALWEREGGKLKKVDPDDE